MVTQAEIVNDLAAMLRDFQGREYSGDIGPQTRFFADLGFASIDAVVLGEMLEDRYGQKFPFFELLTEAKERGDLDLEVGQMAAFLLRYLDGSSES